MRPAVRVLLLVSAVFAGAAPFAQAADEPRPNILFITADDLNYDSPGAFGGQVPGLTPNIDELASEGRRFMRSHVAVAVCQPSRQCMMTGSYPQTNGSTGFYPVRPDVTTLQEVLAKNGYHLGILGKVTHLRPVEKFPWDFQRDMHQLGAGRDPERYGHFTREFLEQARSSGKPFFLMANSHDPHRPFAGSAGERRWLKGNLIESIEGSPDDHAGDKAALLEKVRYPDPGLIFQPDDVPVPGFLPDLPDVRQELAQYHASVHRADQTIGEVLRVLEESGLADDTIVIFLSDNGIALPFAKSNCYLASTLSPCIVRWPSRVEAGSADTENFISGVDLMPTLLEAAGLPLPDGMDGRSFLSLLTGGVQEGRDHVFTVYNQTAGKRSYEMRCRQTARFGYIFNAWSDGEKTYRTEPMTGLTFKAMKAAAESDPVIAQRVELLVHRVPEEFFDLQNDPDALHNLIDSPIHQDEIRRFRAGLLAWMKRTHDPLWPELAARIDAAR